MNIGLIKLLAGVCGVLIAVIIAERQYFEYAKAQMYENLTPQKATDFKAGELPALDLISQPEASYVDMVSRPLFIEGRKPIADTEEENSPNNVATGEFEWELTGIYNRQDAKMALFRRKTKKIDLPNHMKIAEGESLDGWQLHQVFPDKVKMVQAGSTRELILRKPKPVKLKRPLPKRPQPPKLPEPPMPLDESQVSPPGIK